MSASFFFYDLETSGFSPQAARIMQFAGQRTDLNLKPIGEPVNVLIKITPDILPDPDAILLTGITPQKTIQDGISEAEFLKLFYQEIAQPDTTFMGFNSIRFDDEFMRYLHYRNFYDAYEWQWKNGSSRWDLLDVVRMTRALRPDGIEWPFAPDGKPANRLEYLSKVNKLSHDNAHDALSDVQVTIDLARLIKNKQPDLFEYLRTHSGKKATKELVLKQEPFVYTTGRYGSQFLNTSVAVLLVPHPEQDSGLVYDLRFDPTEFFDKSPAQLADHWRFSKDPAHIALPVKTLKYNRCPTVAPLGVLNDAAQERINLDLETVKKHLKLLRQHQAKFASRVIAALKILDDERSKTQTSLVDDEREVDTKLYESFFSDADKISMAMVRAAKPTELGSLQLKGDVRLRQLLPLYHARNYPDTLNDTERRDWEEFCKYKLQSGEGSSRLARFAKRLQELDADPATTEAQRYILEELQLYAESIIQLDSTDTGEY
ncbi:exodeoxyribonuclease I [Candidatus Saccharibacteria bacterium]|nr:exodeoxyribonuclease I [Candidatus Saccharibacteria bacterium]